MRRRSVLAAALAALVPAAPRAAEGPRITILHSGFPERTPTHLLVEALRDLGWDDGRTAAIELLGGEGDAAQLQHLVRRIAASPPAVTIALTSPAALALKRAGPPAAVVFAFVSDPVGLGIVDNLARPGGAFTGVTFSDAALGGKRLELLVDALPGTRRLAIVWSPAFPENAVIADGVRRAAANRAVEIVSRVLATPEDVGPAFRDVRRAGAEAAIFLTDNALFGRRAEVARLAVEEKLPTIHSFPPEVKDGGLMSFGPDLGETYRRTAALADRILRGARPADLPVEEPTRFSLVVNLRAAAALSVTLAPEIVARADEVIE
jgi:putative ABC transport system substrate-binding protein